MNTAPGNAFSDTCAQANPGEAERLEELQEVLSASDLPLARLLANQIGASTTASFSKRDVRLLEVEICRSLAGFPERHSALKQLADLIGAAARKGLASIPAATLHVRFKAPEDKLSTNVIEAHRKVSEWAHALNSAIKAHAKMTGSFSELPAALVIFGFVLFGGVLNLDTVVALLEAFRFKESRFGAWSRGAYCDLLLGWGGLPAQEIRRLYFGWALGYLVTKVSTTSATHLLPVSLDDSDEYAKRIRVNALRQVEIEVLTCLRSFGVPKKVMPKSLREIINTMKVALIPYIPQTGIRYALRKTHARTLRPHSLSLFTGWKCLLSEDSLLQFESNFTPSTSDLVQASAVCASSNASAVEMRMVSEACKKTDRAAAAKHISENRRELSGTSPFNILLLDFAIALLSGPASNGGDFELSTVQGCVSLVQRHLGNVVGSKDLLSPDSDELDSSFWDAIESVHASGLRGNQRTILWALHEMYHHCRPRHCGQTDKSFMFRFRGLMPVNARIISLDLCFELIHFIAHDPDLKASKTDRARAIFAAVAIFGAGLRPSEAIYLRQMDWMGNGKFLIEDHEMHSAKTRNAPRIATNIFPELLHFAEEALDLLDADHTSPSSLLLADRELNSADRDKILEVLDTGLRHVTGDPTANAYILRHSHCTLLRLALACADKRIAGSSLLAPHVPRMTAWLDHADRTKRLLMWSTRITNYNAWAVAKQMGHLSPDPHTESYAHLIDLSMPLYLEGAFPWLPEKAAESAIAPGTRSYNKARTVIEIARREVERVFGANSVPEREKLKDQSGKLPGFCSMTQSLLRHPETMAKTLAETARYLGVDPKKAEDVFRRWPQFHRIRCHGDCDSKSEAPSSLWIPGNGKRPAGTQHLEMKLQRLHGLEPKFVTDVLATWARSSDDEGSVTFWDINRASDHILLLKKLDVFRGDLKFEVRGVARGSEFARKCDAMLGGNVRVVQPTAKSCEQGPRLVISISSVAGSVRGRKHVSRAALEYVLECGLLWFDTDLEPTCPELPAR